MYFSFKNSYFDVFFGADLLEILVNNLSLENNFFDTTVQDERLNVSLLSAIVGVIECRMGHQDDRLMSDWAVTSDGHHIGRYLVDVDLRKARSAQFVVHIVEGSFGFDDAVIEGAGRARQFSTGGIESVLLNHMNLK